MSFPDFLSILRRFLNDSGMTQKELALASGIHASQLSEWLNEKRGVRMGKNAYRVLKVIREECREGEVPIPVEIEAAIRKVWNGEPSRTKILVNLIESLEPAFDYNRKGQI